MATQSWNEVLVLGDQETVTVAVRDRVRLHDTDSSGRIFFGVATDWFNCATAELIMALGFEPRGLVPNPLLPVVAASMQFHGAMELGDRYETRGWVDSAGRTSVTLGFDVRVDDTSCVTGETTHVHISDGGTPLPLPEQIRAAAKSLR